MTKPNKYVLKNISTMDVNLGDLRYTIPAGKSRDLLSKKARLNWKDVEKSIKSGSIKKRLGRSLVEITDIPKEPPPPPIKIAEPTKVSFPQRVKSSIIIEIGDLSEEVQNLSLIEDDELLEVTPKNLRLRKRYLSKLQRNKQSR